MKGESDFDGRLSDLLREIAAFEPSHWEILLATLPVSQQRAAQALWQRWAHEGQLPDESDWRVWMIMAGRGFGKTLAGSQWVWQIARADGCARIALVGATLDDVRKVMIEGKSGIASVARADENFRWHAGKGELVFASGATACVYSAECYERLRGPEHSHAWCDELGKWNKADETWDNLMLGLRLGEKPRVLVTTTPSAAPLLRRLVDQSGIELHGGSTGQNHNLPSDFVETMRSLYEGTRWGRQEIDGELLFDHEGALWSRDLIERCRVPVLRQAQDERFFNRIVIGVDPPASKGGDACGIVAVGLGADGKAYVLADHSVKGRSPEGWARAVAAAADAWQADRVVAEANNGGDMVVSTLRAADVRMPVKKVHASRGKTVRAEPVAALYEGGKAFHAGAFPELEDELCGLISGGGYEGPGRSPDRADALVWAMTELMLGKAGVEARIRGL